MWKSDRVAVYVGGCFRGSRLSPEACPHLSSGPLVVVPTDNPIAPHTTQDRDQKATSELSSGEDHSRAGGSGQHGQGRSYLNLLLVHL